MARRVYTGAWFRETTFDIGICDGICASLSRGYISCWEITLESRREIDFLYGGNMEEDGVVLVDPSIFAG